MRGVLEAAGHEVLEAAHPAAAQRLMADPQGAAVALVLTELDFPEGITGIRFIEWLRTVGQVPALAVALQPAREDVVRMVQAGGRMLVTKPFGPDMLLRRVTEVLKEQEALRQGEAERLTWQIDSFIRREIKRAGRTGAPLAVIVGRMEGSDPAPLVDELMRAFLPKLRESDVMARLSERELFLFLPDTDPAGATNVAQRLQTESIAVGEALGRHLLLVVGTASFPTDVTNASALLALAQRRAQETQGA